MKKFINKRGSGLLILFLIFLILLTCLFITEQIKKKPYPEKIVTEKKIIAPEKKEISYEGTSSKKGKIAIILDDVGWNPDITVHIKRIQVPLTLAILPDSPFGLRIAKNLSGKQNIELLLHIPLEPERTDSDTSISGSFLTVSMDDDEIKNRIDEYFEKFGPYIVGINNHMGSKFTQNQEKMDLLLKEIKEKKLIYVDSLTTQKSIGYSEAKKIGVRSIKRDIFLDNSSEPEEIVQGLLMAGKIAKKKGSAVAIGHARANTLKVLEEKLPEMLKEGYSFVSITQITR